MCLLMLINDSFSLPALLGRVLWLKERRDLGTSPVEWNSQHVTTRTVSKIFQDQSDSKYISAQAVIFSHSQLP